MEIVTASGEEIEEEIVEMYFENKKRSGGGPIKSCVKDGQRLIITFEKEEGIFMRRVFWDMRFG